MGQDILSIVFALIGIAAVLALTYFASRWYAGRAGPSAAGRYIKVIDRLILGKNASILLIELDGAQYLMGVSEQSVSILKELQEPVKPPGDGKRQTTGLNDINFREILGRYGRRKGNGL